MLSNYVITDQKFVLIIDELNRERIAQKFIEQLLSEHGTDDPPSINITVPRGSELKVSSIFRKWVESTDACNLSCSSDQESSGDHKNGLLNIILPTLADLLSYIEFGEIIRIVRKLRQAAHIKRVFLWISPQHINYPYADYLMASFKYNADLIVHFESAKELSIITRRPGGSVSNKRYSSVVSKSEFLITPLEKSANDAKAQKKPKTQKPPASDTFKIELEEDEMVARNALTLPYEKTSQSGGGAIIYTPENNFNSDESDDNDEIIQIHNFNPEDYP